MADQCHLLFFITVFYLTGNEKMNVDPFSPMIE